MRPPQNGGTFIAVMAVLWEGGARDDVKSQRLLTRLDLFSIGDLDYGFDPMGFISN